MRSNRDFLKSLSALGAGFYLSDFHVHSPGSADMCIGERYDALSDDEKKFLRQISSLPEGLEQYDKDMISKFPIEEYYNLLVDRRDGVAAEEGIPEGRDCAFIGVTDHNVAHYATALSKHAWEERRNNRLIILPGIELEVVFPLPDVDDSDCKAHLLCLFHPTTKCDDIRVAITHASEPTWSFGSPLRTPDLPAFVDRLRQAESYPAICVAAHVSSSKGVHEESKRTFLSALDVAIARTEGELLQGDDVDESQVKSLLESLRAKRADDDQIHYQSLKMIGSCGFDALQVSQKHDETHYRLLHRFRENAGRAVPITCSDAHRVADIFSCEDRTPYLKIGSLKASTSADTIFQEIRERALRYGETRATYTRPNSASAWIEGIEIVPEASDAASFWPFESLGATSEEGPEERVFTFSLSRNLNTLIGGRGSGKSAAIDAISFVARPHEFDRSGKPKKEEPPEWYGRAKTNLAGCHVRICWKSTGSNGFKSLKKKALFVARYFDPEGRHENVSVTDLDGKEVLGHSVTLPEVSLFRIHEIEEASKQEKLRALFDQICGDDIRSLSEEIEATRGELKDQREQLGSVASALAELVQEGSPLREFAKRKQQYLQVNQPEVKQAYQTVDDAEQAEELAAGADDKWTNIAEKLVPDDAQTRVNAYFDELTEQVRDEDEEIKPHCNPIVRLIEGDQEKSDVQAGRGTILNSLAAAGKDITTFGKGLSKVRAGIAKVHKAAREELTKTGLPPGGKDRESKKKAFEEALDSLDKYDELTQKWEQLETARAELFRRLEQKCVERTKLRQKTAQEITAALSQDLDSTVLVIEADAQPIADNEEFKMWLSTYLLTALPSYRGERVEGLLAKGLQPEQLRNLLLSVDDDVDKLLVVDKPKASAGKITEADARKLHDWCIGRRRLPPDVDEEEVGSELWADLPAEIKEGLWEFPESNASGNELNVDIVLRLDEVVFDDIPVVRLNDRPQDEGSVARPLKELSPGQRCSAILPILLLTGDCPLIIDQPEDNLDNRLIRQVIVNILAGIKLRRQVIVATHNPNLPVLGDAEQTIVLRAVRDRECVVEAQGTLDSSEVIRYVTEIMEGGREAFQYRQSIYQPHWRGPVSE